MVKSEIKYLLIILAVGVLLRAPLLGTPFWRTGDAVDYINVGRNLLSGDGLVTSVKSAFYNDNPVITSALASRPIGMSLIAAGILSINENLYCLQLFSLMIGILDPVVFYLLARRYVSPKVSLLGSLLLAINPNILISNRLFISEPVFILFIMLGLLGQKFWRGIFFGMAYLIRFEGIFLPIIFLNWETLLAFCAVVMPYWVGNFMVNGNPFYSYNFVHFQVKQFQEYFADGYGKTFPPAWKFISENFFWVGRAVGETTLKHLESFLKFDGLGLLGILGFFGIRKNFAKFKQIMIFCFTSFMVYSVMWSAIFERARHFIPIYFLLMIPVLVFIDSHQKSVLVRRVLLVVAIIYLVFDLHRIAWARNVDTKIDNWSPAQKGQLYRWLKNNTSRQEIVAGVDPMLLNLFVDRPAILLPKNNIDRFIDQYKVKYVLVDDSRRVSEFENRFRLVMETDGVKVYEN